MNAYTMKNKKQAKNSIKKLSILIPAYNESKTIVGILEKIIRVDLPETIKKEIIIIDDCSTDHTDEKVAQVMKSHSEMYIKYIRLKENRGKGYAVRTGITNAVEPVTGGDSENILCSYIECMFGDERNIVAVIIFFIL